MNQKEGMMEKGSWSLKPEDLFSPCNSELSKEQKRLASDNTSMSNNCFQSSNVDSSGSELCVDDTFLGDKCLVEDDIVSQYTNNHISQPDNELSFLDNDGWLDIQNFEDADYMLNYDLGFGLENLDNEEEFHWLSALHETEGTNGSALQSDLKFSSAEVSPLKSISDYDMDLNENIEGLPIHDCNKRTYPFNKNLSSEMDTEQDAVPTSLLAFSELDMKSGSTECLMPKQKMQGKMSKQSAGKRKKGYLKDGGSGHPYVHEEQHANLKQPFGASSSGVTFQDSSHKQRPNTDTDSFGCIQIQTPVMHPDYSHTSLLPTLSGSRSRSEQAGYPSPSFKESSFASNMESSCDHPLEAAALRTSDTIENLYLCHDAELLSRGFESENMQSPMPFKSLSSAQKLGLQFENDNEGHSEAEGVGIGFSPEIESSNVQESSSISSPPDKISLEASSFCQLRQVLDQLDVKTKLCIRDSLYRLAKTADLRHDDATASGQIGDVEACKGIMTQDANRCTGFLNIETNTNPIDRSIAHLLFHRPSDPSMLPLNDSLPFKSSSMIHGSVTNQPIITEKQV